MTLLIILLFVLSGILNAQEFRLFDRTVQVHGFASQGFAYSDNNNWLPMETSKGSFALTDFGVNLSSQLTDKFRVGVQVYDRNVGRLGDWRPDLDWAVADHASRTGSGSVAEK